MEEEKEQEKRFEIYQLKKLCQREVITNRTLSVEICGYTRKQLREFIKAPQRHWTKLISVMRLLYSDSGYFRKIITYYMGLVKSDCQMIDTELFAEKSKVKAQKMKRDYTAYIKEVESFDLSNALAKILFNVLMCDAYFGFIIETDDGKALFAFQPEDCIITGYVNGMPCFGVKKLYKNDPRSRSYPKEVVEILLNDKSPSFKGYVEMPYDKTVCIKYYDAFDHLYPPFTFIIKEILDLEDFKDIEKAKAANEVYKLIAMRIPTDERGIPTMADVDVEKFCQLAMDVVAETIGVLPTPFDTIPIEFSTNTTNNINNVKNAIDEMYSELGVSQALLAGASSGSELKMSIEVDASDMYRILKQVSKAVNFHCRLKLPQSDKYRFVFRFLDVTAFNQGEKMDRLLKMAQASCPVKTELMATAGISPLKMIGNAYMENEILGLMEDWEPMKTAYTQSADSGEDSENNGRPAMDETEISDITQNTHDNEGNDKDNRV